MHAYPSRGTDPHGPDVDAEAVAVLARQDLRRHVPCARVACVLLFGIACACFFVCIICGYCSSVLCVLTVRQYCVFIARLPLE